MKPAPPPTRAAASASAEHRAINVGRSEVSDGLTPVCIFPSVAKPTEMRGVRPARSAWGFEVRAVLHDRTGYCHPRTPSHVLVREPIAIASKSARFQGWRRGNSAPLTFAPAISRGVRGFNRAAVEIRIRDPPVLKRQ